MRKTMCAVAACLALAGSLRAQTLGGNGELSPQSADAHTRAQLAFYNGRYAEAAEWAAGKDNPEDLAAYELRTSAMLFQLRRLLSRSPQSKRRGVLEQCEACGALVAALEDATVRGQKLGRERLARNPADRDALFTLAKLDLNFLWLQLDVLGRRKGWGEYWEAKRSLDALLRQDAQHMRGMVAHAWMDYIVDTRVPRGVRWLLGGGNRKRALETLRRTTDMEASYFARTEAAFALWEMELREKHIPEALAVARRLARDFPDNQDLSGFLTRYAAEPAAGASPF